VIIGLTIVMGIFRYCMRQWIIGASRDIEYAFRNDLFSKLQSLSPAYYDRQRTGDLMAKATSDVDQVRSFLGPGFLQFFNSGLLFPLALWRMIQIDSHLTAIIMAPLVTLPFVMNYFGNRVHRRFRNSQDHYSHMSAMVQENLAGARVVKAFVQEEAQEKLFRKLNGNFVKMNMDLAAIQSGFYPSLRVLAGLSIMLLLWIGGHDAAVGRLTVGEFVEFTLIQTMLFWPMIALGWTVSLMQRGAASMDRITEILELPSYMEPLGPEEAVEFQVPRIQGSDIPGSIEFRNLSFQYGPGLQLVL
jgi:ATP-binding cassette subfamily B protein